MSEPGYAGWLKRVRHVIFDEIHSVGMAGGDVWERTLLYNDAPFLGLSATLGNVAGFHGWLRGVEAQRGRELHLVVHNERCHPPQPHTTPPPPSPPAEAALLPPPSPTVPSNGQR